MEDICEIIDINMKICMSTSPCRHYVTYKDNYDNILKKILPGDDIVKIILRDKMIIEDYIIKHLINIKLLNDENIYKKFDSDEIDILKEMLNNKLIYGCENNPNLFLDDISEFKKLDMDMCYLSEPCCHYVEYVNGSSILKNEIFSTPQIIKIMIKFKCKMGNDFIKHFVVQIINNKILLYKYFTTDEIKILNDIYPFS